MMTEWRKWLISQRKDAEEYGRMITEMPSVVGMEGQLAPTFGLMPWKACERLTPTEVRIGERSLTTIHPFSGNQDLEVGDRVIWFGRKNPGTACGVPYMYERLCQRKEPCIKRARPRFEAGILMYEVPEGPYVIVPDECLHPMPGTPEPVRFFDDDPEIVWGVRAPEALQDFAYKLIRDYADKGTKPLNVCVFSLAAGFERWVPELHSAGERWQTNASDGGYVHVDSASTAAWVVERTGKMFDKDSSRSGIRLCRLEPNAEDLIRTIAIEADDGGEDILLDLNSFCVRCSYLGKEGLSFLTAQRPPRPGGSNKPTLGHNATPRRKDIGRVIRGGAPFRVVAERLTV